MWVGRELSRGPLRGLGVHVSVNGNAREQRRVDAGCNTQFEMWIAGDYKVAGLSLAISLPVKQRPELHW